MDDAAERRIARGLRAGEADAWRALYDAFAEPVWRAAARLLGPSSTDVADVVQETFLAAARSARTYDPDRGSLAWWLHGIARNQIALHFRKKSQRDRLVQNVAQNGQFAGTLACRNPDPLESAELAVQVRQALCDLPPDYEMLLTAKYLDEVAVGDLARRDRSTEVAIRSKLARARDAFRQAFAKYEQRDSEEASRGRQPPVEEQK